MQRLFDGELRAASMTGSMPSTRLTTHASNFSFTRRSVAVTGTGTHSMPNWRKDSASKARDGSSRPTNAVRVAAFRISDTGGRLSGVAKALSIAIGEDSTFKTIVAGRARVGKAQRANWDSVRRTMP